MKYIFITFLLSCGAVSDTIMVQSNPVAKLFDATYAVEMNCDGLGFLAAGTAIGVSPSRALTAKHVVTVCEDMGMSLTGVRLRGRDGEIHGTTVTAKSKADAALLVTSGKAKLNYVSEMSYPPQVGDLACTVSAVPGYAWRMHCGRFIKYRESRFCGENSLLVEGQTIPGSSGSGVFDRWGRLIGVHVAKNGTEGYGVECSIASFSDIWS